MGGGLGGPMDKWMGEERTGACTADGRGREGAGRVKPRAGQWGGGRVGSRAGSRGTRSKEHSTTPAGRAPPRVLPGLSPAAGPSAPRSQGHTLMAQQGWAQQALRPDAEGRRSDRGSASRFSPRGDRRRTRAPGIGGTGPRLPSGQSHRAGQSPGRRCQPAVRTRAPASATWRCSCSVPRRALAPPSAG